jgi:hypothetical protein
MLLYFGYFNDFPLFPYSSMQYKLPKICSNTDILRRLKECHLYKFIFCFLNISELYLTIQTEIKNVIIVGDNSPDVDTCKTNDIKTSLLKIMLSRDFPTISTDIQHDIYNYFFPFTEYKTRWFKPVIDAWSLADTNTANSWLSQEQENSIIIDWLVMIREELYRKRLGDKSYTDGKIENIIKKWKIENGIYSF